MPTRSRAWAKAVLLLGVFVIEACGPCRRHIRCGGPTRTCCRPSHRRLPRPAPWCWRRFRGGRRLKVAEMAADGAGNGESMAPVHARRPGVVTLALA